MYSDNCAESLNYSTFSPVPPLRVYSSNSHNKPVPSGEMLSLSCSSQSSNPPVSFDWLFGNDTTQVLQNNMLNHRNGASKELKLVPSELCQTTLLHLIWGNGIGYNLWNNTALLLHTFSFRVRNLYSVIHKICMWR